MKLEGGVRWCWSKRTWRSSSSSPSCWAGADAGAAIARRIWGCEGWRSAPGSCASSPLSTSVMMGTAAGRWLALRLERRLAGLHKADRERAHNRGRNGVMPRALKPHFLAAAPAGTRAWCGLATSSSSPPLDLSSSLVAVRSPGSCRLNEGPNVR
jgi:hypothetical protein